jgi:hypothetical protein
MEIAALLLVDRARNKFGLSAPRPNLHMCFTGPPGTGKTTVALRMADLLHRLGYLEKAIWSTPCGTTWSPSTSGRPHRRPSGSWTPLLQVMENERDKLVVILAGYRDRMDEFFGSNPGMS